MLILKKNHQNDDKKNHRKIPSMQRDKKNNNQWVWVVLELFACYSNIMLCLIWIQTVCREFEESTYKICYRWTKMVFLKEFLEKVDFEKKISRQQKSLQNYPVGKDLNLHAEPSSGAICPLFCLYFDWPLPYFTCILCVLINFTFAVICWLHVFSKTFFFFKKLFQEHYQHVIWIQIRINIL